MVYKHPTIYTIGYEGLPIDEFITRARNNKIDVVIDVRELPWSRKNGFNRNALHRRFEEEKISYFNFTELGSPRPTRNKLYEKHNYVEFFKSYSIYLSNYVESLMDIITISRKMRICLMCYEADIQKCHRKIITDKLRELDKGLKIASLN